MMQKSHKEDPKVVLPDYKDNANVGSYVRRKWKQKTGTTWKRRMKSQYRSTIWVWKRYLIQQMNVHFPRETKTLIKILCHKRTRKLNRKKSVVSVKQIKEMTWISDVVFGW